MTFTPAEIASFVGFLVSLGTMIGVAMKFGELRLKVDTMWEFQWKRAQSEAVMAGVAKVNSPVRVSDEAKQWMAPIIGPVREFYQKLGRRLTDAELALEIERRFGEQILREVCIPHGLAHGACLLIALQAARDAG